MRFSHLMWLKRCIIVHLTGLIGLRNSYDLQARPLALSEHAYDRILKSELGIAPITGTSGC